MKSPVGKACAVSPRVNCESCMFVCVCLCVCVCSQADKHKHNGASKGGRVHVGRLRTLCSFRSVSFPPGFIVF